MKLKYAFLILVVLLFSAKVNSQEKIYVFFDDIDYMYNTEGVRYSDGVDNGYFQPLLLNNFFTSNLLKSGYAAFFNSGKSLSNYEVAVFYMGDKPLQYDGGTGRRIVSQIKGMLDIGKRVILIGNFLLYWAFDPSSTQRDTEVQNFFKDYLGIDQNAYMGMIKTHTQSGQTITFKPFGIKAHDGDVVTKGYIKICNMAASENNVPPLFPWRSRPYIEAIDGSRLAEFSIPCEFFTWKHTTTELYVAEPTDTVIAVRVQKPSSEPVQDSKIVFWSTGFEVAAASTYIPNLQSELWDAMVWCTQDLPQPGPRLEFNVSPLEFGTVAVEDSSIKEVKITNVGRDPMEIYDMYMDDPFSGFTIETDELTADLEPGEHIWVPIKFKPGAEEFHSDYFNVESNAFNGKLLSIEVNGYGGKKPEAGPRLAVVSNVLDFGIIAPTEKVEKDIEIVNPGVAPLFIMQKFYWPREIAEPFMYAKPYEWSITVQPGNDTVRRTIRFAPNNKVGTFYDTIGIVPYNAVNYKEDTLWIYIKGVSRSGDSDASISLTNTELTTDSTAIGEYSFVNFTIQNTGSKVLYIKKLEFENDFDGTFLIYKDLDEQTYNLPIELAIATGGNKKKVYIKFVPKQEINYTGKLLIEIMDDLDNPLPELDKEVTVTGLVKKSISVVEENSLNGLLSIRAVPSPASDFASIYLSLNSKGDVNLDLYLVDVLGNKVREIKTGNTAPGDYVIPFLASDIPSGMYYLLGSANGEYVRLTFPIVR